jgi:hypothetical protein
VLVEGRKGEVAQQRREDPALGRTGDRVPLDAVLGEDAGFEERLHQGEDASVCDPFSQPANKRRVRDFVEAVFDVSLDHPLVGAGAEEVDLSDRVLRPAPRAEAEATRLEVRLEDRLEHQLEGGLHHPISDGRDPEPALFAAALGDHSLPHRQRVEAPSLELCSQLGEEDLLTPNGRHVVGGLPVHPGRASPSVASHPTPANNKERRVTDEVVEVVEPTSGVVGCSSVQLGLDLQYPRLRLGRRRPRRARVHGRPPGIPVPLLRTRCRPSPCTRLSRARTTTAAPPHPGAVSQRRACPPPATITGGEGGPGMVPTFTTDQSTGEAPSFSPAASPRVRRRLSPWPPSRSCSAASESPERSSFGRALRSGPYPPDWSRFWT